MSTYGALSVLHPDYMLAFAGERLNGEFVGKYFIPDATVAKQEYRWRYHGVIGGMTPEVGENDIGPLIETRYEQRVGWVKHYKERTRVSKFTKDLERVNAVQDALKTLTNRFALRQESLRVNAIVDNCYATTVGAAAKNFFWIDCDDDASNWDVGSGPVDPVKQILAASKSIRKYALYPRGTDTIVGSPDVIEALKNSTGLRTWDRSGPLSANILKDGTLIASNVPGSQGRLAGHEVFESSAVILSDQEDEMSTLSPLLDKDVYVFRRGSDLGAMHTFRGLVTRSKNIDFADAIEIQVGGIMATDIFRPQLIYKIANAIA